METEDRDHVVHTLSCHLICLGCIPHGHQDSRERGECFSGTATRTFFVEHGVQSSRMVPPDSAATHTFLSTAGPVPAGRHSGHCHAAPFTRPMHGLKRCLEITVEETSTFSVSVPHCFVQNRSLVNPHEHSTDHVSQICVNFRQRQ